MERDRSLAACLTIVVLAAAANGCGLLALTDGSDASSPERGTLQLTSIAPETDSLSTSPTLRLRFNDYLDAETLGDGATVVLTSGGLRWTGSVDYGMVDRELIWSPTTELPEGLRVDVTVSEELKAVTGATLRTQDPVHRWKTAVDGPSADPVSRRDVTWSDVKPIFESRCNGCHGDPDWDLPTMDRQTLLSTRSEQVDRPLVRPFDAAGSYLMHKLLHDYPDRRYQRQPPPWSQKGTELPVKQLRTIEAWIDAGAPR